MSFRIIRAIIFGASISKNDMTVAV